MAPIYGWEGSYWGVGDRPYSDGVLLESNDFFIPEYGRFIRWYRGGGYQNLEPSYVGIAYSDDGVLYRKGANNPILQTASDYAMPVVFYDPTVRKYILLVHQTRSGVMGRYAYDVTYPLYHDNPQILNGGAAVALYTNGSRPVNAYNIFNFGVDVDPVTGIWHALVEAKPQGGGINYRLFYAHASYSNMNFDSNFSSAEVVSNSGGGQDLHYIPEHDAFLSITTENVSNPSRFVTIAAYSDPGSDPHLPASWHKSTSFRLDTEDFTYPAGSGYNLIADPTLCDAVGMNAPLRKYDLILTCQWYETYFISFGLNGYTLHQLYDAVRANTPISWTADPLNPTMLPGIDPVTVRRTSFGR